MRLHSPWKVPTHMPRVLIGSMAEMRVSISFAALLVNVTASRPCGLTCPVWMSHAMRVVSTRVLPLPAPARISADCVRQRDGFELLLVETCEKLRRHARRGAENRADYSGAACQAKRPQL